MNKYYKKGFIGWLTASLLFAGGALTTGTASAAASAIKISINDLYADTDVAPYITNGTTMVPLQVTQKYPEARYNGITHPRPSPSLETVKPSP